MDIRKKTNIIKLLISLPLLVLFALPLSAQEKEDSVCVFRFYSGRDMFYVPVLNNGDELSKLFEIIDQFKGKIVDNEMGVRVEGHYISTGNKAEKRGVARIRSNRVKSELITKKGLKEAHFLTSNEPGQANFVTVRLFNINKNGEITAPAEDVVSVIESIAEKVDSVAVDTIPLQDVIIVHEVPAEPQPEVIPVVEVPVDTLQPVAPLAVVERTDSRFALKTNLLAYGVLMPNIEAEWMFTDRWSVAFEAQGAWYAKNTPHKVYRLATWIPEVRYWVIDRSRWHGMYVGVFGGAGIYDLSNGKKGHEGEGGMVGASVGYMWPISKSLSLDAGIGIGYMYARDKVYEPYDGHFLYQYTQNVNYFGPLRAKLSLVWRIPSKTTKTLK